MFNVIILFIVTVAIFYVLFSGLGADCFRNEKEDDQENSIRNQNIRRFLNRILRIGDDSCNNSCNNDLSTREMKNIDNVATNKACVNEDGNNEVYEEENSPILDAEIISVSEAMLDSDLRDKIQKLRIEDPSFNFDLFLDTVNKVILMLYDGISDGDSDTIAGLCDKDTTSKINERASDLRKERKAVHYKNVVIRTLDLEDLMFIDKNLGHDTKIIESSEVKNYETNGEIFVQIRIATKQSMVKWYGDINENESLPMHSEQQSEVQRSYLFERAIDSKIWKIVDISPMI